MIVAMAGLPGTGKSALANALAVALRGLVLSKDEVRAALFAPEEIEYSTAQDDFVVGIMLELAEYHLRKNPARTLLLDGRTFTKKAQVEMLVRYAQEHHRELRIIECWCADNIARTRLEGDRANGAHPAADRDYSLYVRLQEQADALEYPHFTVDTGERLGACVSRCLEYLSKPDERLRSYDEQENAVARQAARA